MINERGNNVASERNTLQTYQELFGAFGKDKDNAKAKAFDELAKLYYSDNFGAAKKPDIDLLMFSVYFDRIIENMDKELDNAENDDERKKL